MQSARLWFARVTMAYAFLIFAFLSWLYVMEPLQHIAGFGISATGSPESINFLRAGPGALFLGMTLYAGYGLARPAQLHRCLGVLVVLNACVVTVRLYGMALDGVTPKQLSELRNEGLSWLMFVGAWLASRPGR